MNLSRKTFNWYIYTGHAWLEVTRPELIDLDIENRISDYSYQQFDFVYLEEDRDAHIFIDAWEKRIGSTFTTRILKYTHNIDIRSFHHFKPSTPHNFTLNFATGTIKPRETVKFPKEKKG